MLGKLTKFEFKATARTMLPLYLAVLVLTLVNKGFLYLQGSAILADYNSGVLGMIIKIMGGFSMAAFVAFIVATLFFTVFISVQRFYKNLFTDEGYLMHTLPVSPKSLIGAKLLVSAVWFAASLAVIFLGIFVLVINGEVWTEIKAFFDMLPVMREAFRMQMNIDLYSFIALFAGYLVLAVPTLIINFYLAIALGSIILPKHKIGGAFLGYVIIWTVSQIVSSIALAAGAILMSENLTAMLSNPVPPDNFFYFIFGCTGLYAVVSGVAGFFITSHIMTKKLNLE